jgi:hypothetical protein
MKAKKSKKKSAKKKLDKIVLPTNEAITDSILNRIKRLEEVHEQRKMQHTGWDKIAFWTFIFVILVSNFLLSFFMVFLILFLQHPLIYLIVILIGLGFGLSYEHMLNGMSHIFAHHHIYAKVFMLVTGAINVFYIVATTIIVMSRFQVPNVYFNPLGVSITYYVSYMVPYFVAKLLGK